LLYLYLHVAFVPETHDGTDLLEYLALYAVLRFILEFFPGGRPRLFAHGFFSTSQFIAVLTVLGARRPLLVSTAPFRGSSAKLSNRTETWMLPPGDERIRLDQYLVRKIPGESRSPGFRGWIRGGHIRVNGQEAKTGHLTRIDDRITLEAPRASAPVGFSRSPSRSISCTRTPTWPSQQAGRVRLPHGRGRAFRERW